jgi:DNA-directed RNA polymerase subunit E'/Rpb7
MEKKNQVAPGAISAGINRQKIIDSSSAIELLRWIYLETKREFKRNEKINASISTNESNCSLTFLTGDVNIQLIIKEGGVS